LGSFGSGFAIGFVLQNPASPWILVKSGRRGLGSFGSSFGLALFCKSRARAGFWPQYWVRSVLLRIGFVLQNSAGQRSALKVRADSCKL